MKKIAFVLFLLNFIYNAESQVKRSYQIFYDSGNPKTTGSVIGKKRVGVWKSYYDNGQVSKSYSYNALGELNKETSTFHKDGSLKSEIKNVNGTYVKKNYYKTGNLKYEQTLSEGFFKEYYDTGELKAEAGINKDGNLNGRWNLLSKNGQTKWSIFYRNGLREGKYRAYHKNGALKLEGNATADVKNGEEIVYYEGRSVKWKGFYDNGLMTKIWIKYDEDGNEIETVKYKIGQVVGNTTSSFVEIPLASGIKEEFPIFPGCETAVGDKGMRVCFEEKVKAHIKKRIDKSLIAKLGAIGTQEIEVSFKINIYGRPTDIGVEANYRELIAELKKVVNLLPLVTPGKNEGKPADMDFSTKFEL